MSKPKSYEFRDQCWNADYILIWPVDGGQLCKFLSKRLPDADISDICEDQGGFGGWCSYYDNHYVIALQQWDGGIEDLGTLSHECNHAAMYTLFNSGVKITKNNQEPLAYLQDSLLRRCLKVLRKKSKK